MKPKSPQSSPVKRAKRPTCPVCTLYCDRERDVKGKFYVACYNCGYDSRYSAPSINPPASVYSAPAGKGKTK